MLELDFRNELVVTRIYTVTFLFDLKNDVRLFLKENKSRSSRLGAVVNESD